MGVGEIGRINITKLAEVEMDILSLPWTYRLTEQERESLNHFKAVLDDYLRHSDKRDGHD